MYWRVYIPGKQAVLHTGRMQIKAEKVWPNVFSTAVVGFVLPAGLACLLSKFRCIWLHGLSAFWADIGIFVCARAAT